MAARKLFTLSEYRVTTSSGQVLLSPFEGAWATEPVPDVPAIFWADGSPWIEACLFLKDRINTKAAEGTALSTVRTESWDLKAFADFLESNRDLCWNSFPAEKRRRPTYRFRGFLIDQRRAKAISPSLASNRISVIKRFYAWLAEKSLLPDGAKPYSPEPRRVSRPTHTGTVSFVTESSDLRIPNRRSVTEGVEDGLFPLSLSQRDFVITCSKAVSSAEHQLFLKLGFFTGMRIGTIVALKESAFARLIDSRDIHGWFSLEVGPRSGIKTKGDVTYFPSIPPFLVAEIQQYIASLRRLKRKQKAGAELQDSIFITQDGAAYSSWTIKDEMLRLREYLKTKDPRFPHFKFHVSRATFGTGMLLAFMKHSKSDTSIMLGRIKALLGHASIHSTLRYIKFVENHETDAKLTEEYASYMLSDAQ